MSAKMSVKAKKEYTQTWQRREGNCVQESSTVTNCSENSLCWRVLMQCAGSNQKGFIGGKQVLEGLGMLG